MTILAPFNIPVVNLQTGAPLPGATVTVYKTGTMTKASLYDMAGLARSNPIVCDSSGLVQFQIGAASVYDVVWSLGSYTSPRFVIDSGAAILSVLTTTPEMYGAVGDGVTDDRAAIEAAAASLGSTGGTVQLSLSRVYRVSSLTVPSAVTIRGSLQRPDLPTAASGASLASLPGLALDSSGTIQLSTNASLSHLFVKRYGMALPSTTVASAGFAGTAITIAGDAVTVEEVMAVGFNKGIAQTGASVNRFSIKGFYADCINGIYIDKPSYDTSLIRDCHIWPYTFQPSMSYSDMVRTGYGLYLTGAQDNTVIDNVLCWGHLRNFYFSGTSAVDIGTIWSDYPTGITPTQTGVTLGASTNNIQIANLQIWGGATGLRQDAANTESVHIGLCTIVGTTGNAIVTTGGDLFVSNLKLQSIGGIGVSIGNAGSHTYLRGYAIDVAGMLVSVPFGGSTSYIDVDLKTTPYFNPAGTGLFGTNYILPYPVSSASSLLLPVNGRSFHVLGTTAISSILGTWGDREITLRFQSAISLTSSGNIRLADGDTSFAAGAYLRLRYDADSGHWIELGRWPDISASSGRVVTAFRNRLINGGPDMWQRGISFTVPSMSAAWLADRWQLWNGGGSSIDVSRVAAPAGFRCQYAMRLQTSGVAAGVNLPMWQGIEARQIADLDGKNVVVSFDMQASTSAGTLNGSVDIVHNSALDNSSWNTNYTEIPFTVPAGAAVVSVPIPAAAMVGAKNGSRVHVVFHQVGAIGNQDIYIGAAQLEADRQVAGAWGNPTPFEFRPLSVELAMCQRYAQIIGSGAVGKVTTASTWEGSAQFKTPMRATPTLTLLMTTISASETGVSARFSSGSTLSVYNVTATGANDLGLSGWSGLTAPNLMTIGTNCILASAEL